jgi:hypothetical protein
MIRNRRNGQRMILTGPGEFEIIFKELEKELGEDITQVAIEAQRGYTKDGPFSAEDTRETASLRAQLALKGFGNLRESEWAGGRLRLRLENPCLNPIFIGLALGLFELSTGSDGEAGWELAEDGDLTVEISPKA